MRKQNTKRVNLSDVMGADEARAATEALKQNLDSDLKYGGKKIWNRVDDYLSFRAEWREEKGGFIYNFYHPTGPDPMRWHDDPDATRTDEHGNEVVKVAHGDPIGLPDSFGELLPKICDYVFKDLGYTYGYVDEACAWRVEVPGIANRVTQHKRFLYDFFEIINANWDLPPIHK